MKEILVTGGLGFIGSNTIISLHNHGFNPIIIDNLSNSSISRLNDLEILCNKKFIFFELDIRNTIDLKKIVNKFKFESVIHFAGLKSVNDSLRQPLEYFDNNINATLSLLRSLEGSDLKSLIFSSTASLYDSNAPLPFDENQNIKPTTPYAKTKLFCEEIIKDFIFTSNVKAIILRYFNPIGSDQSGQITDNPKFPTNLMPLMIKRALNLTSEFNIYGSDYETSDGTAIRDYIHVQDLADAHVAAVTRTLDGNLKNNYDIFNVGTGIGTSVLELLNSFEKYNGIKIPYTISKRRDGDIAISVADISKIKSLMKWSPKKTLKDMCVDSWKRFQK